MSARLEKASAFTAALGLVLLASPCALADSSGSSKMATQAPKQREPVTPEDWQNPEIVKPENPGTDTNCYGYAEKDDNRALDKARAKTGRFDMKYSERCLPQQDSFKSAAEAASYLAFYQKDLSLFSTRTKHPETLKETQDHIHNCVNGLAPPKVDENGNKKLSESCQVTLAALSQYNFGKELKAQMIESQTRARNMQSIDRHFDLLHPREKDPLLRPNMPLLGAGVGSKNEAALSQRTLASAPMRQKTFRLDPNAIEVFVPSGISQAERDKLGVEFNRSFREFSNQFTRTGEKSRWHYVPVKSAAVGLSAGSEGAYVAQMTIKGEAITDDARRKLDVKTQDENRQVQEVVESFQEGFKDVIKTRSIEQTVRGPDGKETVEQRDSMLAATELMGFGLPREQIQKGVAGAAQNPGDLAAQVVVNVNKAIHTEEKRIREQQAAEAARLPSSAQGAPTQSTSVVVDMKEFDQFLDSIWPPSAPKPSAAATQQAATAP